MSTDVRSHRDGSRSGAHHGCLVYKTLYSRSPPGWFTMLVIMLGVIIERGLTERIAVFTICRLLFPGQ